MTTCEFDYPVGIEHLVSVTFADMGAVIRPGPPATTGIVTPGNHWWHCLGASPGKVLLTEQKRK